MTDHNTTTPVGRALGRVLRQLRSTNDMTQEQVVRALDEAGMQATKSSVGSWENGTRSVSVDRLWQLAAIYYTTPSEIVAAAERSMATPGTSWTISLEAATQLPDLALSPVRKWAQTRVKNALTADDRTVRVDQPALEVMAGLCGLTYDQLTARLLDRSVLRWTGAACNAVQHQDGQPPTGDQTNQD
ncbi:helix-turn-helix domain-containing protein [Actinocrispum wychmicini]|uniref:Helix-turn-helix protein n=1 Tax=Actinocrispum wychmicini TaxID=1213861 RepID=A0A4R2ITV0_9PSEU|nr:helix-turn-helix transcriptional regulator [Actinocrispum wychmicini]TCO48002.1 helix-turn-helix protein [Actinocrispum wychmicini]